VLGVEPHEFQQRLHLALDAVFGGDLLDAERRTNDRADCVARIQRRKGSWKIICMCRRNGRSFPATGA